MLVDLTDREVELVLKSLSFMAVFYDEDISPELTKLGVKIWAEKTGNKSEYKNMVGG